MTGVQIQGNYVYQIRLSVRVHLSNALKENKQKITRKACAEPVFCDKLPQTMVWWKNRNPHDALPLLALEGNIGTQHETNSMEF